MKTRSSALMGRKKELDAVMERLHITPVGSGYLELICPKDSIMDFIDEMDRLGLAITGFSWWCHVTQGHEPCGMGGPKDRFGDGWYSEIQMGAFTPLDCNEAYREFFMTEYRNYKPCLVPAFSLESEKA